MMMTFLVDANDAFMELASRGFLWYGMEADGQTTPKW